MHDRVRSSRTSERVKPTRVQMLPQFRIMTGAFSRRKARQLHVEEDDDEEDEEPVLLLALAPVGDDVEDANAGDDDEEDPTFACFIASRLFGVGAGGDITSGFGTIVGPSNGILGNDGGGTDARRRFLGTGRL